MLMVATGGLCALAGAVSCWRVSLVPTVDLTEADAVVGLDWLRSARCGVRPGAVPDAWADRNSGVSPVILTIWRRGKRQGALQVDGEAPARALPKLAQLLRDVPQLCGASDVRLQLDVAVGIGALPQSGPGFALGFVEGRDGAVATVAGARVFVPPNALISARATEAFKPVPTVEPGLKLGASIEKVQQTLKTQAMALRISPGEIGPVSRFRSATAVEGASGQLRILRKSNTLRAPPDRAALQASALAGATYLANSQHSNGKFRYAWAPVDDRSAQRGYSWVRHSGVVWSLSLVGRILERPRFFDSADRGIVALKPQLIDGPQGSRCVRSKSNCYVGGTALALLGVTEHRASSGSEAHADMAASMGTFLRSMQRPDGTFIHQWRGKTGPDDSRMYPYASQQAVLALAFHGRISGDRASLDAAERGMDFLAGEYWDHFLGRWFVAQEHWTAIAVEELQRSRPKPEYVELCWKIGTFYGGLLLPEHGTPFSEDVGGVGVGPVLTPHLGATSTMVEAMISAVEVGDAAGKDTTVLRAQVASGLAQLVGGQVTVHDTF
ncbi:MAG: hypothetical protein ACI9MC_000321, partial [Kiritimatiellia bacterium]